MRRVAVISIIVEQLEYAADVNDLLHEYSHLIVGRMGLPIKEHNISVITIVCIGINDEISALSGKLGRIKAVQVKTSYSAAKLPLE